MMYPVGWTHQEEGALCFMTLFDECITALGENAEIINDCDFINSIVARLHFTISGRVDWEKYRNVMKIRNINDIKAKTYFVIWSDAVLPILKCTWNKILENIDDVLAVSCDTWLVSEDFTELIEFYHDGEVVFGNM